MTYRVLTIEDQPDIRRLIRMTLEFKGYQVDEAADATQGLAQARSSRPDLILLDVMMPGIDGLTASRMLAADAEFSKIPVVMLSALGAQGDVNAGIQAGARAYLVKPFSPKRLLELIHDLLGKEEVDVPDAAATAH